MNKEQAAFFESLAFVVMLLLCGGVFFVAWAMLGAQP
jgi:hypothetical protein